MILQCILILLSIGFATIAHASVTSARIQGKDVLVRIQNNPFFSIDVVPSHKETKPEHLDAATKLMRSAYSIIMNSDPSLDNDHLFVDQKLPLPYAINEYSTIVTATVDGNPFSAKYFYKGGVLLCAIIGEGGQPVSLLGFTDNTSFKKEILAGHTIFQAVHDSKDWHSDRNSARAPNEDTVRFLTVLDEESTKVPRITFERARPPRGLEASLDDVLSTSFHQKRFNKFFNGWVDYGEQDRRILPNLTSLIKKAKESDYRFNGDCGNIHVAVIDGDAKREFFAKDAFDLYVYMSKEKKIGALYVILQEDDGLFVTGKLTKYTYRLVLLKDVMRNMKQTDLVRFSRSIDKLAYEMLKEHDWKSFYDHWHTQEDDVKFGGAIVSNLLSLNLFTKDRFIQPKGTVRVRLDEEEMIIYADAVIDIYVWASQSNPQKPYLVLDMDNRVVSGPVDRCKMYKIENGEEYLNRIPDPLKERTWGPSSETLWGLIRELYWTVEILGRQMVNLPHIIEVTDWLSDHAKSSFSNWEEGRIEGPSHLGPKKLKSIIQNGLRVLNGRIKSPGKVPPMSKQQVEVIVERFGNPVKMRAEHIIDIYLQLNQFFPKDDKGHQYVVVDSNGKIVTGVLKGTGPLRILGFEKALVWNTLREMHLYVQYLAYQLSLFSETSLKAINRLRKDISFSGATVSSAPALWDTIRELAQISNRLLKGSDHDQDSYLIVKESMRYPLQKDDDSKVVIVHAKVEGNYTLGFYYLNNVLRCVLFDEFERPWGGGPFTTQQNILYEQQEKARLCRRICALQRDLHDLAKELNDMHGNNLGGRVIVAISYASMGLHCTLMDVELREPTVVVKNHDHSVRVRRSKDQLFHFLENTKKGASFN